VSSRSEIFRAKVDTEPNNILFLFSLGQAFAEEGKSADAIDPLQRCVTEQPEWMAPQILLGKCLLLTNAEKAAEEILNQALQLAIGQGHEDPEAEIRSLLSGIQD